MASIKWLRSFWQLCRSCYCPRIPSCSTFGALTTEVKLPKRHSCRCRYDSHRSRCSLSGSRELKWPPYRFGQMYICSAATSVEITPPTKRPSGSAASTVLATKSASRIHRPEAAGPSHPGISPFKCFSSTCSKNPREEEPTFRA